MIPQPFPEDRTLKDRTLRIFDAHFHIIDYRYPLIANDGYTPEEFLIPDYYALLTEISQGKTFSDGSGIQEPRDISLIGGAVVSGSFQGVDYTYFYDVLPRLGANWVGVTQLPQDISDAQIYQLDQLGIRAMRWNLFRGVGSGKTGQHPDDIIKDARRVYDLVGWHTEIYLNARDLPEIFPFITQLPKVSIDHLGLVDNNITDLLAAVDSGARVKATGFGRLSCDVGVVLEKIYARNPAALLFGTDLPGTRAPRKYHHGDLEVIIAAISKFGGRSAVDDVLYKNALQWYRIPIADS